MIETPNAIFLHLPKTGGTWIYHMIQSITVTGKRGHEFLEEPRTDKKVFTFVRNPWEWHKSVYMADVYGTEIPRNVKGNIRLLNSDVPPFSEFISTWTTSSPEFFEKVFRMNRIRALIEKQGLADPFDIDVFMVESWKESNKGLYQNMCDKFTKYADYVGRYENLREELLTVLDMSGDLTTEIEGKILNSGKINYTQPIDYRTIYDDSTRDIVQTSCQEMINKYNYTF